MKTCAQRILQWNCRSLSQTLNDLRARLEGMKEGHLPIALLLQEIRGATPKIKGFKIHIQPSILHSKHTVPKGQAAVYIKEGITHRPIRTDTANDNACEAVAVRISDSRLERKTIICSVYIRPDTGRSRNKGFEWIRRIRSEYPTDHVIIGGDFNARHTHWGYNRNTSRGLELLRAAEDAGLELLNDRNKCTRVGLHKSQVDTNPDLTWASKDSTSSWTMETNTWGSDHFPIWISLQRKKPARTKKSAAAVDWGKKGEKDFSEEPMNTSQVESCEEKFEMEGGSPSPDRQLMNLLNALKYVALKCGLEGRCYVELKQIRNKYMETRRYEQELANSWSEEPSLGLTIALPPTSSARRSVL